MFLYKLKNFFKYLLHFLINGSLKRCYFAWDYMRKYSLLPKLMGFYQHPSLKYKVSLIYVYMKYFYYSHNKDHTYILNCIPRIFNKYYLAHKTHHFDSGHEAINKIKSYRLLAKNGFPIPNTIGVKKGAQVIDLINEEPVNIETLPENLNLFCKKISGSAGVGAKIIKPNEIGTLEDDYIIQENMTNGEFIREITNEKSTMLNSMRIHTYRSLKSNKVIFLASYLKLGVPGRINDNYGLCVSIDNETGKLSKYGSEFGFTEDRFKQKPRYDIESFDNNSPLFENYSIPNWIEIKEMITKASGVIGTLFVGWDVALTDQGIVILECNSLGDIFIPQAFDRPFYNTTLIQDNLASAEDHIWIKKWKKKYYRLYNE